MFKQALKKFRKWKHARFLKRVYKKVAASTERFYSKDERYLLITTQHKTKAGCWEYSRGQVFSIHTDKPMIAEVCRNYSSFLFCWVLDHPNGHDYLICGEDYQGQTIIELDSGRRRDVFSPGAEEGHGFCWTRVIPAPSKTKLAVEGCFWAGPYEVKIFDFIDPMKSHSFIGFIDTYNSDVLSWEENEEAIRVSHTVDIRKSDGTPEVELTSEELEKADAEDDWTEKLIEEALPILRAIP